MSVQLSVNAGHCTSPIDVGDERALIEKAKRSAESMGKLFRLHHPSISGYVHRRVGCGHDADDIIADVFLQMVKSLHKYQHRGIPFRIWLYRIATNQVNRWARRKRRSKWFTLQPEVDPDTVADAAKQSVDAELVQLVLQSLPVRLQSVLSLHYLEGLTTAEVATVLKCSAGTVKSRLHDGRRLMRTRLELRGFENERS